MLFFKPFCISFFFLSLLAFSLSPSFSLLRSLSPFLSVPLSLSLTPFSFCFFPLSLSLSLSLSRSFSLCLTFSQYCGTYRQALRICNLSRTRRLWLSFNRGPPNMCVLLSKQPQKDILQKCRFNLYAFGIGVLGFWCRLKASMFVPSICRNSISVPAIARPLRKRSSFLARRLHTASSRSKVTAGGNSGCSFRKACVRWLWVKTPVPGELPESLPKRQQWSGNHPQTGTLGCDPQPDPQEKPTNGSDS